MKKHFSLLLVFAASIGVSKAQSHGTDEAAPTNPAVVKWMTFEQAVAKSKIQKKKIFIDVFTDWCGWCKVMDKNTFSEPQVAKILNEDFYPVKFNAEQREDVKFNGTTFKFIPNGNSGVHQLAAALLNNQLSYPTVVFLDEDFTGVYPIAGYRKAEEFHSFLVFFTNNAHKKGQNAYQDFLKTYKSPYKQNAGE